MVLGMIVGGMARLIVKDEDEMKALRFKPDIFFFVLLPPIIFEAGYSMRRKRFFRNFSTIIMFALIGTMISTFIIGFTIFGLAKAGWVPHVDKTSPLQSLMFGALISSVDPVAMLSIMGNPELNCDKTLYSLVFGESVLNDAVTIVLFKTFSNLTGRSGMDLNEASSYFLLFGEFIGISIGSVLMGAGIGFAACFVFKNTQVRKYPSKEIILLLIFSYMAYAIPESVHLSGIMSLFFCGVVLSHYNVYNLSESIREGSFYIFRALSHTTETFVVAYMGISTFTGEYKSWSVTFGLLAILACLVSRACNTFPLSALANLRRKVPIPPKMQGVIWFAGLRGSIAFALSLNMPQPKDKDWNNDIIVTTTLIVVYATTFISGTLTLPVLNISGMRRGHATEDEEEEIASTLLPSGHHRRRRHGGLHGLWSRIDDHIFKPYFGGDPRLEPVYTSSMHGVGDMSEDEDGEASSQGEEALLPASGYGAIGGQGEGRTGRASSGGTFTTPSVGQYQGPDADVMDGDLGSGTGDFFGRASGRGNR